MTWKSHIAIATAIALPFNPAALPAAVLGSTAPDWSEWVLRFFGIDVGHRGFTHYLIIPLAIVALGFLLYLFPLPFALPALVIWFGIGYLSHWFADSMTISGVPLAPGAQNKIHFFGGKFKTGDMEEYIISFGLLAFSALVFAPNVQAINPFTSSEHNRSFNPYYMDYGSLFKSGIIDQKEYKESRFKLF